MVAFFIVLIVLIILLGLALSVLVYSVLELCHISNDMKIAEWRRKRRDCLWGTGYTKEDVL